MRNAVLVITASPTRHHLVLGAPTLPALETRKITNFPPSCRQSLVHNQDLRCSVVVDHVAWKTYNLKRVLLFPSSQAYGERLMLLYLSTSKAQHVQVLLLMSNVMLLLELCVPKWPIGPLKPDSDWIS